MTSEIYTPVGEHIHRHDTDPPDGDLSDDDISRILHEQVTASQVTVRTSLAEYADLRTVSMVEDPLAGLQRAATGNLSIAGYFSLADFGDDSTGIRRCTEDAANVLVARLQSVRQVDRRFIYLIVRDDWYFMPATAGMLPDLPAADYLNALWLSTVTRHPRLLTFLLGSQQHPAYPLPVADDDYTSLWGLAWQQLHHDDPAAHETLRAAQTAAEASGEDYAILSASPAIEALRHATHGAAVEFNRALAAALRGHRTYCGSESRQFDLGGFIAWPLLALACYAVDRGIELTVTSDYLPSALVDRAWTLPLAKDFVMIPKTSHDDDGLPLLPMRLGIDGTWELLPD
ncbi:immunity 49 family protein [Nocardia sp. NPDC057440]|uniref:immunity 49 family protein n=1 Tax=Nocardia sp. NPDC057440 TaxID=3346134 RepID=UPI00366AB6D7